MTITNGLVGYAFDDGGRKAAGYKGKSAGDCVTRACSILLGDSYASPGTRYSEVYREMAHANSKVKRGHGRRTARDGVYKLAYDKVFAAYGFVKIKLPKGPRPTYGEAYERYGDCIVSTANHLAAIVNGEYRDTYDDREYEWKRVYCYDCEPSDMPLVGDTEAKCNGCGNYGHFGLFEETRERKAQSVWVRGGQAAIA